MKRKWLIIAGTAGALGLTAAVVLALVWFGIVGINDRRAAAYPILGIDVSHHNGTVDWQALKAAGVRFTYIKASEGGDHTDSAFEQNWKYAAEAGITRGAYHFFTFCRPGIDQARNFISKVPVVPDSLPPAIDFQPGGNCSDPPDKEDVRRELRTFIAELMRVYGKRPVLYTEYDSYRKYLTPGFEEYPVWIQDLFFEPNLVEGVPWTFWQYSIRGRRDGVSSYVHLSAFHGSEDAFKELLAN